MPLSNNYNPQSGKNYSILLVLSQIFQLARFNAMKNKIPEWNEA